MSLPWRDLRREEAVGASLEPGGRSLEDGWRVGATLCREGRGARREMAHLRDGAYPAGHRQRAGALLSGQTPLPLSPPEDSVFPSSIARLHLC